MATFLGVFLGTIAAHYVLRRLDERRLRKEGA